MPTSFATRVTSAANDESWSTIVLIVSASWATSPFAWTVILRERSPRATAVVTSAMLRTCVVRLFAIELTLSVRPFHVPAAFGTSAWPPSTPSVPTSRATPVTWSANTRSVSIIELIVSASEATSPFASIVNFWFRSPFATAVTTLAMPRTCVVRLVAMKLTLSVRSFQVPLTPLTFACPPRIPSVPTSRATRVTSSAKDESWSTIVLIVFLRRRISPLASTVIFRERSPWATAVVTSAMFRTWSVRFEAMPFTDSVRPRHVPETPSTSAWPPSLPSVPTSRATRVTSAANTRSVSIIELIVSARAATSPLASIVNFWLRLPSATAVTTLAIPRTCVVRLVAMKLTLSVRSFQVPLTPLTFACPPSLPSVPTSRATRVTSSAKDESWSTIVLMVSLSSATSPLTSTVIFLDRSPFATAVVTSAMFRTCEVRLDAMKLTLSVSSRQIPERPLTRA